MNNFVNFLETNILPIANKFGQQRHMTAIRKGIIATLPLTIVGSFLLFLVICPYQLLLNF